MNYITTSLLLTSYITTTSAFSPSLSLPFHKVHQNSLLRPTTTTQIHLLDTDEINNQLKETTHELKNTLIQNILEFRQLKEQDGTISIDFGVKGGELNNETRAPQKVDFYKISKRVGDKATNVTSICERLSQLNPIPEPTRYLGDKENGQMAPLNGAWKSLFSTAADANFDSRNSTRGTAKVQNVVNATKSTITNVVDFDTKEDGTEPLVKQLNVVIKATAVNAKRVELTFRYARVVLTRFLFWKCRWSLYIPVPAPFITRIIVFVSRIVKFGRKGKKKVPKGYFDVLFLDNDLRIHRTGEDNLFVQGRESWSMAKPLLN